MSAPLVLDNISVALAGARVVDGVSLRVDAGEIVTLLGANGAGKTTLLRTAVGLLSHEGVCALCDADPRALTPRQRALYAAYLPQRPQSIWPVSVESLVALGRFAHGAAPDRLARADQLAVRNPLALERMRVAVGALEQTEEDQSQQRSGAEPQ